MKFYFAKFYCEEHWFPPQNPHHPLELPSYNQQAQVTLMLANSLPQLLDATTTVSFQSAHRLTTNPLDLSIVLHASDKQPSLTEYRDMKLRIRNWLRDLHAQEPERPSPKWDMFR